ncbi:hypothetical protein B0H67DRAFT_645135 [Lasiosphaeris hirsuta]|uniref:NWD NACHT-NTPase N-terminal domain-containing protein n=1 Tax=Lasiosphaeris hirsuta TaxID=260670 RepID=A0AA40AGE6_9PEZI|nr:hypothetical protein B0H67DRAFT_645135 [Lasiosphaeris hirsuta]
MRIVGSLAHIYIGSSVARAKPATKDVDFADSSELAVARLRRMIHSLGPTVVETYKTIAQGSCCRRPVVRVKMPPILANNRDYGDGVGIGTDKTPTPKETFIQPESLWDRAYKSLCDDKLNLMQLYEQLVDATLSCYGQADSSLDLNKMRRRGSGGIPTTGNEALRGHLLELYKAIIGYEVQCTLRFFRHRFRNLFRDIVKWDPREEMLKTVKELGTRVENESMQINSCLDRKALNDISQRLEAENEKKCIQTFRQD